MPGRRVLEIGLMQLADEHEMNRRFDDLKSRTNSAALKNTVDTVREFIVWRGRVRAGRNILKGEVWKQGKEAL